MVKINLCGQKEAKKDVLFSIDILVHWGKDSFLWRDIMKNVHDDSVTSQTILLNYNGDYVYWLQGDSNNSNYQFTLVKHSSDEYDGFNREISIGDR